MSDSNAREHLDARQERNRERRIEAIKRWVEYVESRPPEKWGPQQNAIVDDQLEAARSVRTSAAHQQRLRDVAEEILAEGENPDDDPR
jgi:hypothetical protein